MGLLPSNWITVDAAVKLSGYHPNYIRRLARKGTIKAEKIGLTWFVDTDSLQSYVAKMQAQDDPRCGPDRGW